MVLATWIMSTLSTGSTLGGLRRDFVLAAPRGVRFDSRYGGLLRGENVKCSRKLPSMPLSTGQNTLCGGFLSEISIPNRRGVGDDCFEDMMSFVLYYVLAFRRTVLCLRFVVVS